MSENDEKTTLVWLGGAVKALGDGKVGGYLVRYGTPDDLDLEGDYFSATTDFGEIKSSPVYYNHGLDPALKTRRLGMGELKDEELGVWIEAQLNMADEYEKAIYAMAEAGKLGWSSGTASHLASREKNGSGFHITSWPLGLDASLTPTPAEPRNRAVPIKSISDSPDLKAALEAAKGSDAAANEPDQTNEDEPRRASLETVTTSEDRAMSEKDTAVPVVDVEEFDQLKGVYAEQSDQLDAMSAKLNEITAAIENSPKVERGGYATNMGGANDPEHKSFGDFLLAVKRGDTKRLATVYNSRKDLLEGTGTAGGFLVPEEFAAGLLQIANQASQVANRVMRVPVGVGSGVWPALDYSVSPTAGSGQTALAAGLSAATTEEGAALTEDEPAFKQLEWRLHKVGGFTQASNELVSDSPQAIEALLTNLFGITIANKNERNIIRGSGSGEPLGILNAACAVAVTTATNNIFAEADAMGMLSRFKRLSASEPVWLMHPGVIPDLASFTASNIDMVDWREGVNGRLLGYPIIYSEHMPQDDNDDVILADLGSYLFFQKGVLEIAFSEHVGFTSDLGTWRFTQRNDGMPWLTAAITLADPTGSYTVSPFVYHDD